MFYVKINVDNVMFDKKGKLKFVFLFLVLFAAPFFANAFLPKLDLIKGSGPEVYLLEKGTRHWIPDQETFAVFNFIWENIKTYTNSVVGSYPRSEDWDDGEDYPDGSLLKGSGPEVYLIELGKKRWIPSPGIFTGNGFGWKYIISVDDDVLDDFDEGAFLTLSEPNRYPETSILSGPSQGEAIESTDISFTYTGTNPLGDVSELEFETYLSGYDDEWEGEGDDYVKEYDLSGWNGAFTFFVRAMNEEGYVDHSPASWSFQIGVSSNYGAVEIDDISYDEDDFENDYLVLVNESDNAVNMGGWTIETSNETADIPQAIHKLRYPFSASTPADIVLAPDDEVIISVGISPQGIDFRTNKCAGYLDQSEQFYPSLNEDCPVFDASEYSHLKTACRSFIDDLDECEIPDYSSNYEVGVDNTCVAFLNEQFNYAYCYNDHYLEVDFFGDEWRVFLGKSIDILNNVSDKVILRDGNGLVVWEYEY